MSRYTFLSLNLISLLLLSNCTSINLELIGEDTFEKYKILPNELRNVQVYSAFGDSYNELAIFDGRYTLYYKTQVVMTDLDSSTQNHRELVRNQTTNIDIEREVIEIPMNTPGVIIDVSKERILVDYGDFQIPYITRDYFYIIPIEKERNYFRAVESFYIDDIEYVLDMEKTDRYAARYIGFKGGINEVTNENLRESRRQVRGRTVD